MKDLKDDGDDKTVVVAEKAEEKVHEAEAVVLAVKPQNVNESFWEQFPDKISTAV